MENTNTYKSTNISQACDPINLKAQQHKMQIMIAAFSPLKSDLCLVALETVRDFSAHF